MLFLKEGLIKRDIPRGVWVLGFVSFFMDVSSEMIHGLLPVFLVSALGAGPIAVGLIEGIAEATALFVKVFSGGISDFLGRRKELALFGYGLGALSKPLFAVAGSVNGVFFARFMDRIGKGLRGAPRDALLADMTAEHVRGAAFGLRQSLDSFGAFLGPLLAILFMTLWRGNFRFVFWVAVIPGIVSVALLAIGIQEPEGSKKSGNYQTRIRWNLVKELSKDYWWVVAAGAIFSLARFSEAFLVLRASQMGLVDVRAPAVFILMNAVYAFSAYPAGFLADKMDRRLLLAGGLLALIAADFTLARAMGLKAVSLGVGLWGLHLGLSQGLLAAMVAGTAPVALRGTAFGINSLVSGVAMLAGNALAGGIWHTMSPAATFYVGAAFSSFAFILLFVGSKERIGGSLYEQKS